MAEKTKLRALITFDRERLAELHYQEGRPDKAARMWASLGQYRKAGQIALALGDVPQAIRWLLREALGDGAGAHEEATPAQAAGLVLASGFVQEAMTLYELGGESAKAADCAVRLKLWHRAARSYEKARDLQTAAVYYERAGKIDEAGRVLTKESERLARARHAATMDSELGTQHREVDLRRVKLLRHMGHTDAAARLLRQWKPRTVNEAKILEDVGEHAEAVKSYLELNRPDEALRVLEASPTSDPRLKAEVYLRCGRMIDAVHLWANLGNPRKAAEVLEEHEAWELAAQRWESLEEPLRAAQCFEKADRKKDAARCYLAGGKPAEAAKLYGGLGEPLLAAKAYIEAKSPFEAATCFLSVNRTDAAMDQLKQVSAGDKSYSAATLLLVPRLIEDGDPREALRRLSLVPSATRVSESSPPDWMYWEARALESSGRIEEAKKLYRRLLSRRSEFRDAVDRYQNMSGAEDTVLVPRGASSPPLAKDAQATRLMKDETAKALTQATMVMPGGRLQPGYRLAGRYKILSELGRGGMGQVYKAYDKDLKETVAIKSLLAGQCDPADEERLLREVQICRKISHPNIVRVHDLGRFEGGIFITMEFIEGLPLTDLLKIRQKLERARALLAQLLAGLKEAHSLNVVHRDLKPSNIMVSVDKVKILDFGIARMQGFDATLTQTGAAIGSPLYMSPEQLRGQEIDGRSDLYSLGVVLYTLLAGREPFVGSNLTAVALGHLQQPPPDIKQFRADLPDAWIELVEKLLEKSAGDRFQSAAEVEAVLPSLPV